MTETKWMKETLTSVASYATDAGTMYGRYANKYPESDVGTSKGETMINVIIAMHIDEQEQRADDFDFKDADNGDDDSIH